MNEIIIVDNFLSKEESIELLNKCNSELTLSDATIGDYGNLNTNLRKSSVSFIKHLGSLNDKLTKTLYDKVKVKGGSITKLGSFQFTKYNTGDFFEWHTDSNETSFSDRYYSVVILLNDEYNGGILQIKTVDDSTIDIEKKIGTLIMFPSFLLHRVTNIEDGIRYSIVNWVGFKKDLNYKKTLI